MNTIIFNELDSYDDLKLVLISKTIPAPEPKTTTVDIPGGDSVLDFSEYFGNINYKNRKLSFEFNAIGDKKNFLVLYSDIQNQIHGKKMKVILSDDPDFYYYGRVTINEWKTDKNIGKLTIEVDAEPYKYKKSVTLVSDIITSEKTIVCINLRKPVVPRITVTAETTIKFGNYQVTASAGTFTDDNIVFEEGQNVLSVSSLGSTVSFEYQERGL